MFIDREMILQQYLSHYRLAIDPMQFPLNTNSILHRLRKNKPEIHMEMQNTLNSQSNPEGEEQC